MNHPARCPCCGEPATVLVLAATRDGIRGAAGRDGWSSIGHVIDTLKRGAWPISPLDTLAALVRLQDGGEVVIEGGKVRLRVEPSWPSQYRGTMEKE